jgi:hypothetical protein
MLGMSGTLGASLSSVGSTAPSVDEEDEDSDIPDELMGMLGPREGEDYEPTDTFTPAKLDVPMDIDPNPSPSPSAIIPSFALSSPFLRLVPHHRKVAMKKTRTRRNLLISRANCRN